MYHWSKAIPKRYRIFLSSTFIDLSNLRDIVIHRLRQAGLFYFAMEFMPSDPHSLEEKLKEEIQDSDIFILLVRESVGSFKIKDLPVTQFEFEFATKLNKPIIAYFTDNGSYGDFSSDAKEFKKKVLKDVHYHRITGNDEIVSADIICNIFNLICTNADVSYWVRSDISTTDVEKIAVQKDELCKNIFITGNIIQEYEKRLSADERNTLVGPLVKAGLRPNISGQTYLYAVGRSPDDMELNRGDLKYEYCIDRFVKYNNGAIYDRKLNLTWYVITDKRFTWCEAIKWKENVDKNTLLNISLMNSQQNSEDHKGRWRLPTIIELMTLITFESGEYAYIDEFSFPVKLHWFWSSTLDSTEKSAYYIETLQAQVLKDCIIEDEDPHRKIIVLCTEGNAAEDCEPVQNIILPNGNSDSTALRFANQSKRIISLYLSGIKTELSNMVIHGLTNAGYFLSPNENIDTNKGMTRAEILNELEITDYYILVIDNNNEDWVDPFYTNKVTNEISVAREKGIPIILVHNLKGNKLEYICNSICLNLDEIGVPGYFKDNSLLTTYILTALANQQKHMDRPGWIKQADFISINKIIESVNKTFDNLEFHQNNLIAFINKFEDERLGAALEKCQVLFSNPEFGTRTRFVSKDTPFLRLCPAKKNHDDENLPILFAKILNRFSPDPSDCGLKIVCDCYLNLKWSTIPLKNATYDEAIVYALRIAEQQKMLWRLPTVEELITLLTDTRGRRKFMDEQVFPMGRWYWTSTRSGQQVYYVDFNNLEGAVQVEIIEENKSMSPVRRKSVLLVMDK